MPSPGQKRNQIAVIPARGGSKRVRGKNIRTMLGKPLIAYTIEAALTSGLFARVVVSTDSEEIAKIAERHGAEVPFLRDLVLADDDTPVSLATVDALNRLDPNGEEYQNVAQLMANCPLRDSNDVCASFEQFVSTAAESQISVTRFGWQNPWWAMERTQSYELRPIFNQQVLRRSQDLPELLCPTGVIWWAKAEVLRREKTYHVPTRTGWEIPWQRGLDIDTEDDWAMAEMLMSLSRREVEAHV
ncbi:MAG: acylneuraminate cytidylyltransferase family protein [Pyrinomonadaceae bacterium]|nr:acylneuraminate cytidylyltransferase family protein [Pyrinomonadaceae bacterium]